MSANLPPEFSPSPRPMPAARVHRGRFIALLPQDPARDAEPLFEISHGDPETEKLWTYLPVGPFGNAAELRDFLKSWGGAADVLAFTVRASGAGRPEAAAGSRSTETGAETETEDGAALGSISLMSLRPAHGVGELGNIWFCPAAQRTRANTEANYLLLKHCFEDLGYRRMEWKCNALNLPSRKAALRLGFTFEGIFRQHMIVKGLNRDTAWFSMLDHEWPEVKRRLEAWLESECPEPLRGSGSPQPEGVLNGRD
ncbi:MAG: GCN5-related N-acetyltransferase [Verrucomicrobiales bacterium]|nr:GCN5-related N-acetyltransferase [Verrucomicrobiales bacterium]